jgi:hypothetical protein
VAQPGRGEVEGGMAIGECTDHACAFRGIVSTDFTAS